MNEKEIAGKEKKEGPKRISRGRQVNIRLSNEQYATLEAKAQAAGLKPAQIVRQIAAGIKVAPRKQPIISDDIAASIATQLRYIGNNLNQLARHANSGGSVSKSVLEGIQEELGNLWRFLSQGPPNQQGTQLTMQTSEPT